MKYRTAKQLSYHIPNKPWRQSVAWVTGAYAVSALIFLVSFSEPVAMLQSAPQAHPIAIELADVVAAAKQQNLSEPEAQQAPVTAPKPAPRPKVLTSAAPAHDEQIVSTQPSQPKPLLQQPLPATTQPPVEAPKRAIPPKPDSTQAAVNITQPTAQEAEKSTTTQLSSSSQSHSSDSTAQWQHGVLAKLQQMKRYPAYAQREKQQDVVLVHFRVDAKGQLLSVEIQQSKGYELLEREVRALVKRAAPYPAPPASALKNGVVDMVAPINFFIQ
ncbi:TonB family protein [Acinetobacter larvae]|uniref:Protein TonB n=1 Tax=Acinetobacter larvae TaxID=1789224 RepID=A0A1B2M085_9GAMM|nr:TonB family protein [Acinetobacter larvae]AOA58614.1 hypothetical protein BFG52_09795 [Acinetobacter larvae]